MYSVFMDEKGPQETFTLSQPFSMKNKLAYGTDEIFGYIGNVWRISDDDLPNFSVEYEVLEKQYLMSTQNPDRELKGSIIVKGNFKYGVASLKPRNVKFYSNFFRLLFKYDTDNLLFSINKMSVIVDSKLLNWLYLIDNKRLYPDIRALKYIITKFLSIEAKEEVISKLLDPETTVKEILWKIEHGMQEIVNHNRNNRRMVSQLKSYKEIIKIIKNTKHYNLSHSKKITFDWNKITYDMSLWLDEKKITEELDSSNVKLYLDGGIDKKYFEELSFGRILDDCDSSQVVGLRVTDMLVVIAGNYIKNLSKDTQYDYENPETPVMLDEKWFILSEDQFILLKLIAQYYLGGSKYSFIVDTYFDQERLFESFLRYIDSYRDYKHYNSVLDLKNHVRNHFQEFIFQGQETYKEFFITSKIIRKKFGSVEQAVSEGVLRPI
ncbi:hypothetical protein ACYSNO_03245 [Enterococcus sp. LJL98]